MFHRHKEERVKQGSDIPEKCRNVIKHFTIFLYRLTPEDLQDGVIQLRYVRFQDVTSITAS